MKIQVLCGMIASGKSTYCKNAAGFGFLCINDDDIVNMLHGNNYSLYDKALKPLYKTLENQIVGTVLAMGRSVVIDRGLNISIDGRQRWLALAKSYDVECEAIVFHNDGPSVHAERRHKSDARGRTFDYWMKVADFHHGCYCLPTTQEGFSFVRSISFDEITKGQVII